MIGTCNLSAATCNVLLSTAVIQVAKKAVTYNTARCPQKLYLILKLYFEAENLLLMSAILAIPASLDLYNSFDTLFACFHGLMNKWH